jgi:c-di-GMP-binding flagellar brake protein YcgR
MDLENIVSQAQEQNKLEIDIPTKVVFQLSGVETFLKSELVGLDPDNYLIIKSPRGDLQIKNKITAGNLVLVNYLFRGCVYTFQSHILGSAERPFNLFFLSYPKVVSRKELRRDKRVDCYLSATVNVGGEPISGAIVDLSQSGCKFVSVYKIPSSQLPSMEVGQRLELSLDSAPDQGSLGVVMRNKRLDKKALTLGLEFQELRRDQWSYIGEFVRSVEEVERVSR